MPHIGIFRGIGGNRGGGTYSDSIRFESGDGTTLNTSKWTVTNPTVLGAEFEQRNAVVMHSLEGTNANLYANNIKGSDSRAEGAWFFSLLDIQTVNAPLTSNANFVRAAGLANSDFTNSIEFYRSDSQKTTVGLRIRQSSSVVYDFSTTIKDLALIKLIINASHEISVYRWVNDAWVQIDETQTFDLGSLSLFMATKGYDFGKTALRDIYIATEDKYPTELPVSTISTVDAREFGAVPDGTTDSVEAINDALVAGDVIIQNGEFVISEPIIVPSGRRCYIKNARIKTPDASYINIFRFYETPTDDIKVIGFGNAVLDGNSENNHDNGTTHGELGTTEASLSYITMLVTNITNFEFRSLNIVDFPRWAWMLYGASHGVIDDLYESYGNENHNQDGLDICSDCHDINISNVRTMTDDDALGFFANNQTFYATLFDDGPIFNINVTDYKVYYTPARALIICGEGSSTNKIYDLTFTRHKSYKAEYGFLNGLTSWYTAEPAADDVKDITFTDCEVNTTTANPIRVLQNCENIQLTGWVNNSGKADFYMPTPKEVNDFNINGVSYPIPIVVTATVEDNAKDDIVLTFNTKMDQTITPATSVFTVDGKTVSGVEWYSEKVLIVTVGVAFANGNSIVIDYTKPESNPITNLYGNEVVTFTDQDVTNNIIAEFPADLLAHWKMNGDLTDSSGGGFDLTNDGGTLATDRNSGSNKAYAFANGKEATRTMSEANLQEFTICGWIKSTDLINTLAFVSNMISGFSTGWGIIYVTSSNSLRFFVDNWSTAAGKQVDIAFTDESGWHFFCASYKKTAASANLKFSIDDGTVYTADYNATLSYSSAVFRLGHKLITGQTILVDGVALFSRELSVAERTFMYNYED